MGSGIAAVLLGGFLNGSFVVPMRNRFLILAVRVIARENGT